MSDEWLDLASFLAVMIEKYGSVICVDELPDSNKDLPAIPDKHNKGETFVNGIDMTDAAR